MVSPIKSATPPYRTVTIKGPMTSLGFAPDWYYKSLTRLYIQAPPFNRQLPLSVVVDEVVSGYVSDPTTYVSISDGWPPDTSLWQHAYNRAYSGLQESVNDSSAQLGANLGELKKTADTVNNRVYWLFNETARLHHKMAKKLAVWKRRKRWKYRRYARIARRNNVSPTVAGLFIEYRWVYEATAKDIYNAVDFMQNFSPTTQVKGQGKTNQPRRTYQRAVNGQYTLTDIKDGMQVDRVKLLSEVAVTNPNLFWAQQMGLTNPAAIAWELTKFSWLIDWFGTLGEVINSWDDKLGLEFSNPCMVIHREMTTKWSYSNVRTVPTYHSILYRATVKRTTIERDSTLGPGPFLLLRQIKGPSLVRGATAIALLTQLLRR